MLDNFEHVIEAAPALSALLAECHNLDVLVTSRERLQIAGEHVYPVPVLKRDEARALFAERARALRPDFEPGEAVDRLCERLDDLPLALELAAARIVMLTPEQLLERLGGRLDLLRGGRDADLRQQTLRATIEWSYELLDPAERELFARLGVFVGGSTLTAAEAVCGADLDTLQSLVEKNLVRVRDGGRFWMLETIREFAAERLRESGSEDEIRTRHVAFYVSVAEELEPRLDQAITLVTLAEEEGNLRAALTFSRESAPEAMLALAGALWRFWSHRAQLEEGCRWLDDALERAEEAPSHHRARALRGLGALEQARGHHDVATSLQQEALVLYRALGDDDGAARCLNNLGNAAVAAHDLDRAESLYRESLAAGVRVGLSPDTTMTNLALIALARSDFPEARRLLDESAAAAREHRDDVNLASAETTLAWLSVAEERWDEVARLVRDGLRITQEIGGESPGDSALLAAFVGSARGNGADAARVLGALLAQHQRLSAPDWSEQNWWAPFDPSADLERELREGGYDAELAEGETMPFEEALRLAQRLVD